MKNEKLIPENELNQIAPNTIEKEKLKGKIILLMDVGTLNLSCSRCGAGGDYGDTIKHKPCCSYIGGGGC